MIELFKKLRVGMEVSGFHLLKTKLQASVSPPWSYVGDRQLSFTPGGLSTSFAYSGEILPDAKLSLAWYDEHLSIGNIVPSTIGQLTITEYNGLFDDFYARFLKPALDEIGLQATVDESERDIADWLDDDALRKLRVFSSFANMGTGASHPADRERWISFVIAAYRSRKDLPSDVLGRWLIEVLDWPETSGHQLAGEYENYVDLLKRYEAEE